MEVYWFSENYNGFCDTLTKNLAILCGSVLVFRKLPLISQQKYNVAIKKILQHAGIIRSVVWLNPTTGKPEVCPIYEVMSSHSARRAFSGNMYDKVQDPNLVCALTGHVAGSRAFTRYRTIDIDMMKDLVKILEGKQ